MKDISHADSEGIGNSHPDLLSLVPRTFMPPLIFSVQHLPRKKSLLT